MNSKNTYIKDETVLRVISGIATPKNYFNSKNNFIEILSVYSGYSNIKVMGLFKELEKQNLIKFENQQVLLKSGVCSEEALHIPSYILSTQKVQDQNYHLRAREWEILLYLNNKKNLIHFVFESNSNELKDSEAVLYVCIETIAKHLGYSKDQVRLSIEKISRYFENFWERPSEENKKKRFHKESNSGVFNLPERKEWKTIIENKVLKMTSLKKKDLVLPVIIDKKRLAEIDKKSKKAPWINIANYGKMLTRNKQQSVELWEGRRKLEEIRLQFRVSYLLGEVSSELDEEVYKLLDQAKNIKNTKRFLELIRELENKISPLLE